MRSVLLGAVVGAAVLSLGARAAAGDAAAPPAGSPYRLDLRVDLPVLGLGATGLILNFVEVAPAACLPDCEAPETMNGLDRSVIGHYSPSAHTAADLLVAGLVVAPLAIDLADSGGDGWIEDTTVALEVLMLTQTATQLAKFAVRRPAPIAYDASVPLEEREGRDAGRSFFSGHAATAFAAASSYSTTYWLRHPRDPWRWVVLATAHSLAMATGLLKIHAGYHYWTDIGAGALVGSSIGVLVPLLHRW